MIHGGSRRRREKKARQTAAMVPGQDQLSPGRIGITSTGTNQPNPDNLGSDASRNKAVKYAALAAGTGLLLTIAGD